MAERGIPTIPHWIDGAPTASTSGRTAPVFNPAIGAVAANVVLADQAEADTAIASARRGFEEWSAWSVAKRQGVLFAFRELLNARKRELAAIISRAIELHRLTDSAFDITFAGAGKLWSFKTAPKSLPDPEKIKAALQLVNAGAVKVSAADNTVDLPTGMKIGLGGIAKGYGVDRAMKILMDHGIRNAIVDAGGDMKILVKKFGEPWEIAIKHPRRKERALAVLNLNNTCLVTSGDYERFFELEGKRYHHIIDPRTGYPAEGCMSASVVAPNAEYADALATSMCVLGPEKGLELIERLPRIEAVLVGMNGKVHVSSGLRGQVPQGDGNEPASE